MKQTGKSLLCLALVFVLLSGALAAAASTVGIVTVMQAKQEGSTNQVNISFRTQTSGGAPVSRPGTVTFKANGRDVRGKAYSGKEGVGHILVVDTSAYYYTALNNTMAGLSEGFLRGLPGADRVMVITADSNGFRESGWRSQSEALKQVQGLRNAASTEVNLFAAIERAVDIALSGGSSPAFVSSIMVVTDAMVTPGSQSGIISKMLSANRSLAFVMGWPERDSYLKGNFSNVAQVKAGRSLLESFAREMGGEMIAIPHTGAQSSPVLGNTQPLSDAVRRMLSGIHYYTLDLSPLVGAVKYTSDDTVRVEVMAGTDNGFMEGVPFNSRGIPTPTPSPAPKATVTPSPSPTPVPAPTPLVKQGDNTPESRSVVANLQKYFYLTEDTNGYFTEDAVKAFEEFLMDNRMPITDGVYEEAFKLLTMGTPRPKATPTPPPPSPSPTPAPRDFNLGDNDKDTGTDYILRMQNQLNTYNYFKVYNLSFQIKDRGILTQDTIDAANYFVERNGGSNLMGSAGVSVEVWNSIISYDGDVLTPSPSPEPTPTPGPAPYVDIKLGTTDREFGDARIERLQAKLHELKYFESVEEAYSPGVLDTATLQAVALFSERNKVLNGVVGGISGTLHQNILNNNWGAFEATPTPLPPSFIESTRAKLEGKIAIGDFEIPVWVVAVVGAVLLLAIIIVMVMLRSGRKEEDLSSVSRSSRGGGEIKPTGIPEGETPTMPEGMLADSYDSDATVPGAVGVPATILVEYAGNSHTETPVIGDSLTIGRKNCDILLNDADKGVSRRHAQLYSKNGQIYIRDLGSVNGTFVDGVQLAAGQAPSQSEVTVAMDMFAAESDFALTNGAKVRMGHHTLTITW